MSYKLIEPVKAISSSITHQFSIADDTGKVFKLRKWEDNNGGGYFILNENSQWVDFSPNEEMEEWIDEELGSNFY